MEKEIGESGFSSSMGAYEATKVAFARLQACTNDTNKHSSPLASWGFPSARGEKTPFMVNKVGSDGGKAFLPEEYGWRLPMGNISPSTIDTHGWKSCLYFKQGICKNGSTCRFLHGLSNSDEVVVKKDMVPTHAKAVVAQAQEMESTFPISSAQKGLNLQLCHQQQSDLQRGVTMHLGSEDIQKYSAQTPQIDKSDWINNRNARQIYLTFSPDSIFSKEDVCNYFSIYGMVQDVRIPYQEKRMFGFVTFACQMTVKLILARGNPHYICDARILVKPYKEKEKVSNKFSKFRQPHQSNFSSYTIPNSLLDCRGSFDLQQRHIGPRILYKDIASHDSFIRMNLEEEQQATEQWKRCLMRLKLLNLQNKGYHLNSLMAMGSHVPLGQVDRKDNVNENDNPVHLEDTTTQDNRLNGIPSIRETASGATSIKAKHTISSMEEGEFGAKATIPDYACGFLESEMKYNLPDSLFSSPTKASNVVAATYTSNINITSPNMVASNLFSPNIHP